MGAGWCPPGMLGIGIGGTAEKAMLLAKESLMGDIDMAQLTAARAAEQDRGAADRDCSTRSMRSASARRGWAGLSTVLDVKILDWPTHAASKPIAMIPNCAATRHAHFHLDGSGPAFLETPDLERLAQGRMDAVEGVDPGRSQ